MKLLTSVLILFRCKTKYNSPFKSIASRTYACCARTLYPTVRRRRPGPTKCSMAELNEALKPFES